MIKTWKCPKCGREFERKDQPHSCAIYPLEKHFKNKEEIAKPLYDALVGSIKKNAGPFKVESLPCCIHLVKEPACTFAAVYALRNRIRIHFTLDHKISNPRIDKFSQMSANRHLYSIDIASKSQMDSELMRWIGDAYRVDFEKKLVRVNNH